MGRLDVGEVEVDGNPDVGRGSIGRLGRGPCGGAGAFIVPSRPGASTGTDGVPGARGGTTDGDPLAGSRRRCMMSPKRSFLGLRSKGRTSGGDAVGPKSRRPGILPTPGRFGLCPLIVSSW